MALSEHVRDIVAPLFADGSIELVDVEHTGPALRIIVDRAGGLDLEALTDVTRRVSRLLDEEDPVASRYTLEVSTPGLERPLRLPEHFVRAVGREVRVKTRPDVPGDRRVSGVLESADDEGIVVRLDPAEPDGPDTVELGGGPRRIGYGEIERAHTVFQWAPAPKPGKGSKPGAARAAKSTKKKRAATP